MASGLQLNGTAIQLPSILNLKPRVEEFLLNAQMALRDYSAVFAPLLGKNVPKGNMLVVLQWAEKEFGTEDIFTKALRDDHDGWIKYIADMRDVLTHPDSKKGPFEIYNFVSINGSLVEPTWLLQGKNRASIAAEMEIINRNLLLSCELNFHGALQLMPLSFPAQIIEIPEAERNPLNPIRFRMGK